MKLADRRIVTADRRTVKPREKVASVDYTTPEHRAWALEVKKRGGWKCAVCGDRTSRLFADHIIEIQDGGSRLDPGNGQILCASHHAEKTAAERAKRAAESLVQR